MDENIILESEEVNEYVVDDVLVVENEEPPIETEVVVKSAEVDIEEEVEIEIEEAIGWVGGDTTRHYSLNGRDEPNQHPIGSITGLRAELDAIEALKTVYSNEFNVANYYKWEGNKAYDDYGYFVSIVPGTSTIKICDGSDIFGVSVDDAGFIGGQDALVARDSFYGLIVTSGLVGVHCELEIKVGDYVVSNARGYAKKSGSDYGYKVLALKKDDTTGETYAIIALGVQADVTNALGLSLNEVKEQVNTNYKNIISAVNVANQAYQKANEVEVSNQTMSGKVDAAVGKVDGMATEVESLGNQVSSSVETAAQAKAIAESAATSADSLRDNAVKRTDEDWKSTNNIIQALEPIATWKDDETGASGADYLTTQMTEGIATTYDVKIVDEKTEKSMNAITRNAKELQSLMTVIDKYSVGEYSTAYGLTLEQATSILEPGIIYVPTVNHDEEYGEYKRNFLRGYLYRWGEISDGQYGWITVDKDYSVGKLNTSAPAVFFTPEKQEGNGNFGYWYTEGDNVADGYEPYTLYKWEEDHWLAVATLAGNTQSRAISQVRQTANSIEVSVTNMKGDVAASKEWIEDNSTNIQNVVTWKDDNAEAIATTIQKASDSEAYIAQIASVKNEDGTINAAASIITAVNDDTSGVVISANHINLKGQVTFESFDKTTQDRIDADTIDVQIWSSRGNIFKGGDTTTILTCHVFKAGVDITSTLPNSAFTWEKINNDGTKDEQWTATPYGSNANVIQISSGDIWSRAVFNCAVTI